MQVFEGAARVESTIHGCILTIGNFDGLHLGHAALLDAVLARGRARKRPTAVYTFDRHPRRVLQPQLALPRLMTSRQLEWQLRQRGIDALIVEPFTPELAGLAAEEFIARVLVEKIRPSEVVVGRDFRFGRGRQGSDETLQRELTPLGVEVDIIPQVFAKGEDVSSTRIRGLLIDGRVGEVGLCLGRPYSLWGRVVAGDRRGRELGFPTANLECENELIPARGVYATSVQRFRGDWPDGEERAAVTNVGTRPTFTDGRTLVETHLLDFDGDLYGERLALAFHARLRDERRFSGPDELRRQIARDADAARSHFTLA